MMGIWWILPFMAGCILMTDLAGLASRRNQLSERLLKLALKPNMSILDVGCGVGEMSFLANDILHNQCTIIGIDKQAQAIASANQQALAKGLDNVQFVCMDVDDVVQLGRCFDAVMARRVLMYVPKPKHTLQALSAVLKPDGVLALQEADAILTEVAQNLPLNEQVMSLVWQTVQAEGGDVHIGRKLFALLEQNGFVMVKQICEATVQTHKTCLDLAYLVAMMRERMAYFGLLDAHPNLVQALANDTLAEQLSCELKQQDDVLLGDVNFALLGKKRDKTK